ncbi:MAG: M2 family metallopeptidase [Xanthomonadaceae bacterium]|nr:M2 family metallopeptidase [Xanthomonadaceae bacterium]
MTGGHPRGLYTLFFTEMWERFSYYGMRAILILFLAGAVEGGGLGIDIPTAGAIYGLYTASVYLLALPGGWIADRLLGQQQTVFYGGIVIAAGHFTMALPYTETIFIGLTLIAVGTGLLKPNISAIVGDLYPNDTGARRDAGFSIFYMGINLGAFLGPLVCGWLGEGYNWHWGFGAAGVGMVLGLIQYKITQHHLGDAGKFPTPFSDDPRVDGEKRRRATLIAWAGTAALVLLVAGGLTGVLSFNPVAIAANAGISIVVLAGLYFAWLFMRGGLTHIEKQRIGVIVVLFIGAAMFWSGFEQAGSSLNLFAERHTDRMMFGWEMPASWLQSVNALFIITLAPFFAWFWVFLARRNLNPSIPAKFALGLIQLGIGFGVMAVAATFAVQGDMVLPTWLVLTYLLHTTGELCLSPVGLSAITKLSPRRYVGQMMGVWFIAAALGNLMAGLIAGRFDPESLEQMPGLFSMVLMSTAGLGVVFLLFLRPFRNLTHRNDPDVIAGDRLFRKLGIGAVVIVVAAIMLTGCSPGGEPPREQRSAEARADDPDAFVENMNAELRRDHPQRARTAWVNATYITPDTNALAAASTAEYLAWISRTVEESKRFVGRELSGDTARMLLLLQVSQSLPAPRDAERQQELSEILARLRSTYGSGRYCPDGDDSCRSLPELERVLADNRDYDAQLEAWTGWRTVSRPMRADYIRFVELMNEGANELGFEDAGRLWRSGYDMDADEFYEEADRLWQQVRPLYDALHCHVRATLNEQYGDERVPLDGPIPAHLLGNMWAQSWDNLYPWLEPYPGEGDLDVTAALREQEYDPVRMTRLAEDFFVSLGMPELPETFWERAMLTKPRDRDVQCHASAWDLDLEGDVRIKMCIEPTQEMLTTIYHELGHVYYFLMYNDLPYMYQSGAHDGFHEGIGDTLELSLTPGYLQRIGLVGDYTQSDEAVVNQQMQLALAKIAFLPFGKLVDQWRWDVFSGDTPSELYNERWWQLREEYQGVAAPVARTEQDFDPGAKFHVPNNTPYTRYFLSHILQFQFHRALCDAAGYEGPLHACSIYGSEEAGERLQAMLALGQSKPWQDALEQLTGSREMDATAIIDYFAPLMGYLEEQNQGRQCGW